MKFLPLLAGASAMIASAQATDYSIVHAGRLLAEPGGAVLTGQNHWRSGGVCRCRFGRGKSR